VVEDGGLGRPRCTAVVMRRDRVQELRAHDRLENDGTLFDQTQAEVHVTQ
jgi:hypothetical protein